RRSEAGQQLLDGGRSIARGATGPTMAPRHIQVARPDRHRKMSAAAGGRGSWWQAPCLAGLASRATSPLCCSPRLRRHAEVTGACLDRASGGPAGYRLKLERRRTLVRISEADGFYQTLAGQRSRVAHLGADRSTAPRQSELLC